MDRPRTKKPAGRAQATSAEAEDLRSAIFDALATSEVDEQLLRRCVWTYVGAERHAGTSPGHVIMSLTEVVEAAGISPTSTRQALMRSVILWCVEAYFGHLGGDVVGRDGEAFSDAPVLTSLPQTGGPNR
jgi:hypothetical protein